MIEPTHPLVALLVRQGTVGSALFLVWEIDVTERLPDPFVDIDKSVQRAIEVAQLTSDSVYAGTPTLGSHLSTLVEHKDQHGDDDACAGCDHGRRHVTLPSKPTWATSLP